MLKRAALLALGFIVVFLVYVATQSGDFEISRSVSIRTRPQQIHAFINDLHQFNRWNPFMKVDPEAASTYTGPSSGVGATHSWDGKKVGKGSMTIVESIPGVRVKAKLSFLTPFEAVNEAHFLMTPEENETTSVTWKMTGTQSYLPKLLLKLGVLNMEKMVGSEFEKGLAELKQLAEAPTSK